MKLQGLGFCIALVGLAILAGCGGAQSRYASHMEKGNEFLAAENYEKARIEFRNALQILPNDAQGRYQYGRSMERLGKLREAAGMYQGAIDIDTNHAGARAALGRVYVFAGAPEKALELVEPALKKNPLDAELLTVRAAARSQLKQQDAALADAEQAVRIAPTSENAVALLASIYRQKNDAPRAIALLKGTLEKTPQATELRQVLSLLFLSVGDKPGAEEQMRQVIAAKPADLKSRYQLAIFLSGDKRLDDAEKVLKDAIAAAPDQDDPKLVYADFLAAQRDPARGLRALQEFIAKNPDNFDLSLGLGALHQRKGAGHGACAFTRRLPCDEHVAADLVEAVAVGNDERRLAAFHHHRFDEVTRHVGSQRIVRITLTEHHQVRIERGLRHAPCRWIARRHFGPGHRGVALRQGFVEDGARAFAVRGIDLQHLRQDGRLDVDRQRHRHQARLEREQRDQRRRPVLLCDGAREPQAVGTAR